MPATVAGIHLGPDTHANRPAANAAGLPVGSLYVCSTHSLIYQTDGSAWATWATLGGGAIAAGDVSITDTGGYYTGTDVEAALQELGAGAGGGTPYALDEETLDATFGDDFTAGPMDAKWTGDGITVGGELFSPASWMSVPIGGTPIVSSYYQSITAADEIEVTFAGGMQYQFGGASDIIGVAIADSSGVIVGCGFHGTSGDFGVYNGSGYTYTNNQGQLTESDQGFATGRKVWMQLAKRGTLWFARFSMNGNTWSRWTTAYTNSLTPARVYMGRHLASTNPTMLSVDRFNAVRLTRSANRMITPSSGTVSFTASSSLWTAAGAADGTTTDGSGTAWAAGGAVDNPMYWQATWTAAQSLNRVMAIARPSDHFGSGYVEFSDGSRVPFTTPIGATWVPIDFPTISTTSLKIVSTRGRSGAFPGLLEVEAYLAS